MQLEKIMGPEAMGTLTEKLHFTDAKVCKDFLTGLCPHDLFSNTVSACRPFVHLSLLKGAECFDPGC